MNTSLQVKIYRQKGLLSDSLGHTTTSMMRLMFPFLFYFLFFRFLLYFILFWGGGGCKDREQLRKDWEKNETKIYDVKDT